MAGEPESLDQDEDLAARDRRHAYDRTIMLSDGVFAIAITLLAFDIRPPDGWDGRFETVWPVVAPELSTFVMGFTGISFYWLLHRRLVSMMARVDAMATALNLVLLGLVALMPAATRIAEGSRGNIYARGLDAANVMAIGVSLAAFWGYAAFVGRLVFGAVPVRARWVGLLAPVLAPSIMLIATSATSMSPDIVPIALVLLFVPIWILVQRLLRPSPVHSSEGRSVT